MAMEREQRVREAFQKTGAYYQVMREWHTRAARPTLEPEILRLIEAHARGRILDAGSGEGSVSAFLARGHPAAVVVGTEFSAAGMDLARPLAADHPNLRFVQSDLLHLPFGGSSFDLVVCQSVVEHLLDYRQALSEFFRVLRPGGHLILRTGNAGVLTGRPFRTLLNYLLRRNRPRGCDPELTLRPGHMLEDHMHHFDTVEIPSDVLLRDARRAGFRIPAFTTRQAEAIPEPRRRAYGPLKRAAAWAVTRLPIFPFTHLGPTTILLGEKPA